MVTLVLLTRGERGTQDARLEPELKDIRAQEARNSAALLGVSRLIQEDFGDGALAAKRAELTKFMSTLLAEEQPDLLITYDLAGFYGHPDHIICSEVVTDLQRNRFQTIPLWYVTFPAIVLARARMPEHMATHPYSQNQQALPTRKIFIGTSVFPKIRSWYAYKSQRASLTKGLRKLLPIWFFLSMVLFEYFAEVN
ncbi:hypothetical protein EPA93_00680 [Ktedonosporobacter rubrisoli]|uniref:PIG-L family deacetylase n=1 Tax=Ktedonosporobacter rubrisoli TaxID=2509675 RepID=A0A4P6JHT0_KTERU|nr:PIG-L deacetylase family protein [Ktedonosporobacter rubrisoli]QBD74585.1 hypothetical protein EPA93_00680 [Ktedonosporobacter rubrisoli]